MTGNYLKQKSDLEEKHQQSRQQQSAAQQKAKEHESLVQEQNEVILRIKSIQAEIQSKQKQLDQALTS